MVEFLQFTLSGIVFGMVYAAIALSLVLIWRGTRLLNFAQGGMAMFTTYVAIEVIYKTHSYWAGFVDRARGRPRTRRGLRGDGVDPAHHGQAAAQRGDRDHRAAHPPRRPGRHLSTAGSTGRSPRRSPSPGCRVGGTPLGVSRFDVFVAAAVLVTTLVLAAAFRYTSAGLRMRAAAFNATIARLSGIRVARVLTVGWALAGLLGALAGVLVSPSTFLYPNSMDTIFVYGFTAAVLGGLDSALGAVVGGLVLGLALSYAGGYLRFGRRPHLAGRAGDPGRGPDGPAGRAVRRLADAAGMTMRTLPRRLGVAIVVAAIVVVLSIKLNAFRDYQIAEIAVYVTAVAGLTVLTGLSGQISLGNGAFMAIGAYTTALLLLHLNWPFYAVLVVAAAVTAVAGAVVGVAAARLRGPYLAGATLMLGVALPAIAYAWPASSAATRA